MDRGDQAAAPPPPRSLDRNIFPFKARFGIAAFSAGQAPPQQLHFRCDHCCDRGEPLYKQRNL
jgi:hypothetical protein